MRWLLVDFFRLSSELHVPYSAFSLVDLPMGRCSLYGRISGHLMILVAFVINIIFESI